VSAAHSSRRAFLAQAGFALTGLAVGSRLVGGGMPAYAAASTRDWTDLARSVRGQLLLPGAPQFDTARLAWNTLYDDVMPQAVLRAASTEDVRKAIVFCRDTGVRPIPRSGGHSFQGFSTGTGLIIDMSMVSRVSYDPKRDRVRIGAGATLLNVYDQLYRRARMTIAGGTCPTVGISGLTMGGGVGPFTRQYGLTLDRLVGAHVVTADGRARRVDSKNDPDLFWAIRGGGGGSYGVVTSFDFRPVPADMPIVAIDLEFAWRHVERVMTAFQSWVPTVPRNAHPGMTIKTSERAVGAEPVVAVSLWHRGSRARADAEIRDFLKEVAIKPVSRSERQQAFFEAEYDEYCQGLERQQCDSEVRPPGVLPRLSLSTYSEISRKPWPRAGLNVLIQAIERWQRDVLLQPEGVSAGVQTGKVIIEPIDGAVHEVAPTATAFPHRDGFLVYQFQARTRPGAPRETVQAAQAWLNSLYADLSPWRTGAEYSNYGNRQLQGWQQAYFSANVPRLRSVKASVDPANLFRFEQSLKPASPRR
jgi:FAD/FMN-containing dehydrogenase